ncbi:MAG: FhaA domain-containing protein [Rhodoglobus sp.]
MGLLDSFEKGLERAVNGAFAKTFKSGLQPVEITSALRKELDTKAAVVSRDRILVPNTFTVFLSHTDYERMTGIGPTLIDELCQLMQQHATAQRYSFSGGISISLAEDSRLSQGMIEVESVNVKGNVSWTPVLDINGKRHPIKHSRTIVGRGSDATITVDDTGISRKHVEILWDGTRAEVSDLGSTNGSLLNGKRVSHAPLPPDSVIDIGRTRIVFRVLAQATTVKEPLPPGNSAPRNGVR